MLNKTGYIKMNSGGSVEQYVDQLIAEREISDEEVKRLEMTSKTDSCHCHLKYNPSTDDHLIELALLSILDQEDHDLLAQTSFKELQLQKKSKYFICVTYIGEGFLLKNYGM